MQLIWSYCFSQLNKISPMLLCPSHHQHSITRAHCITQLQKLSTRRHHPGECDCILEHTESRPILRSNSMSCVLTPHQLLHHCHLKRIQPRHVVRMWSFVGRNNETCMWITATTIHWTHPLSASCHCQITTHLASQQNETTIVWVKESSTKDMFVP